MNSPKQGTVSCHYLLAVLSLTAMMGLLLAPNGPVASADELLSSFEQDLSSSVGVDWATSLVHSYETTGATEGTYGIEISHGTAWTQDFFLDGGTPLAQLVASHGLFQIDVTTPATQSWRQVFVIMQGAGLDWSQIQYDAPPNTTSTLTINLVDEGWKAAAAAGDMSWWQAYVIFQGGDDPAADPIQTTLDNVRFGFIPEPGSLSLLSIVVAACGLTRRSRRK